MAGGWVTKALLLLCWLQVSSSQDGDPLTGVTAPLPVAPSHGDVKRMCNGLVMIYMGPDGGTEYSQMWGTLHGDNATEPTVINTLCHQLGYGNGGAFQMKPFKVTPPECAVEYIPELVPVWLSKMHCNETKNHILSCDHNFNMTTDHGCDTYIKCYEMATHSPFDRYSHGYIGQVTLFSPSVMNSYNATRSSGIVILKDSIESNTWRYFKKNVLVGQKMADTVCRAMGFTHAVLNSVISKSQSDQIYAYEYEQWRLPSSILSSNIDCQDSCQCLGCCMSSSLIKDIINPNWHPNGFAPSTADHPDALILRCTFSEASENVTSGSETLCEFSSTKLAIQHPEVCPVPSTVPTTMPSTVKMVNIKLEYFVAICVAPTCFFGLLIIGIFTAPRAYRKVRGCRRPQEPQYQVVEENN